MRLSARSALLTGAGSGIGRALAVALVSGATLRIDRGGTLYRFRVQDDHEPWLAYAAPLPTIEPDALSGLAEVVKWQGVKGRHLSKRRER